ncbi:MaoC-like domain containing protein [Parasponia andersonii]|uniref:MaoC-like domain containing protein n=1 Tax=Parasponia andersonii TaxID=3476 RepID=A0A2P5CMP6_PARAD|nr:MaoC-like domain containing protein [Parasponia andersonii]
MPSFRCFSSSATRLLKLGDSLKLTRIFSNEDVIEYAKITSDYNPVHLDSESARNAGFEDQLVHGMLVASLFPQIISSHCPGAIYASQSLQFKVPIYIGEEIFGEMQLFSLRRMKNRYLAKFKTSCFKHGDLLALDGEAVAILPSSAVAQVDPLG